MTKSPMPQQGPMIVGRLQAKKSNKKLTTVQDFLQITLVRVLKGVAKDYNQPDV